MPVENKHIPALDQIDAILLTDLILVVDGNVVDDPVKKAPVSVLQTTFDAIYAALSHNHAASDITSGTLADARVAESNVTQHQAALVIASGQVTGLGTLATVNDAPSDGSQYARKDAAWEIIAATITLDTIANILASDSPASGDMFFATDVEKFLVYDGAAFRIASIPFGARSTNPNIGAGYPVIEDDDPRGYFINFLTNKTIYNSGIGGNDGTTEGGVRLSSSEIQFYLDSEWKTAVTGFRFREDENGTGILEYRPAGSDDWINVTSGNSARLDPGGNPAIWNWRTDIGALQSPPVIGGRVLT